MKGGNMRIKSVIVKLSIVFILCSLVYPVKQGICATVGNNQREAVNETYENLGPFIESLTQIQQVYVDESKVKGKSLIYGAIRGMLMSLDPYSQFLDPQEYKELQSETTGNFGGLGIEIAIRNDILTVVAPIDKTPAYQAGIKPGDRIVKINGESTKDITLLEAVRKLRGPKGTKVIITVSREGIKDFFDLTITRDIINIISVWKHIVDDNTGYIKIRNFAEKTAPDMEKAILELKDKKIKAIIIDLRNNPGGLLSSAVDVSNYFLQEGTLIVYTEGRMKAQNMRFVANKKENICDEPLVILVNKGSASASEIVTGAIKDNNRGVIIGSQTFGKGSVQTIYNLSDDSGIKITTAYYYTPSGKLIHEKGITPDIVVEEKEPSEITWKLKYKEYFINFAKKYVKENPKTSIDSLQKIDDKILDDFIKTVHSSGFEISNESIDKDKQWVKRFLKVEIIRELKGEDTADVADLSEDPVVQRAIDVLKATEIMKKSGATK